MERFVVGAVVVIPFPFSDLSQAKRRPAVIVAMPNGDDVILCQITSQEVKDKYAIELGLAHFQSGGLKISSNVRPNKIFTADKQIILRIAGQVTHGKLEQITAAIIALFETR